MSWITEPGAGAATSRARRWWIGAALVGLAAAGLSALLIVRAQRMRAAGRGGRVFHVSLPSGAERTVIVRPPRPKSGDRWEWSAW